MTMSPALTQHELALLISVFRVHPAIREVTLFGSRAKGTQSPQSDVDLALLGDISALQAAAIAAELDELPLPYHYDVLPLSTITLPALREHIERAGIVIYTAAPMVSQTTA